MQTRTREGDIVRPCGSHVSERFGARIAYTFFCHRCAPCSYLLSSDSDQPGFLSVFLGLSPSPLEKWCAVIVFFKSSFQGLFRRLLPAGLILQHCGLDSPVLSDRSDRQCTDETAVATVSSVSTTGGCVGSVPHGAVEIAPMGARSRLGGDENISPRELPNVKKEINQVSPGETKN